MTGQPTNRTKTTSVHPAAPKVPSVPVANMPKKIDLDELLEASNSQGYITAAGALNQFYKSKGSEHFSPAKYGSALLNSIEQLTPEIKDREGRMALSVLSSATKRSLQEGTLDASAAGDVADFVEGNLSAYARKLTSALSPGHYKTMAAAVFVNKKDFGDIYRQLSTHPSAAKATRLANMLEKVNDAVKTGDPAPAVNHGDLIAASLRGAYSKQGSDAVEAGKLADSASKAYKSLVGKISDAGKIELQREISGLLATEIMMEASNLDSGYMQSTLKNARASDLITLGNYAVRRGRGDQQ